MKKNALILIVSLLCSSIIAQISNNDDYVNLYQLNEKYPGFISYTYRGLHPVGHAQFKMYNYGGTPEAKTALGADQILGSYVFNGYNGSQNVISAIIRARTITASNDPRLDFVLARPNGGRTMRMTIIGETGMVGIGVSDPTERLDIAGNIRMRTGAGEGKTIVSDVDGKMTWIDPLWRSSGSTVFKNGGRVKIGNTAIPIDYYGENSIDDDGSGGDGTLIAYDYKLLVNNPTSNTSDPVIDVHGATYYKQIGVLGVCTGENNHISYGSWSQASNINGGSSVGAYAKGVGGHVSYGIRAIASGATTNWAGYFEGNTKVTEGMLEVSNLGLGVGPTPEYGIYSSCIGDSGERKGVYGFADCSGGLYAYGTYGEATGESWANYGLYGAASGTGSGNFFNYAGYFSGNVTVTGTFANPSDARLKKNVEKYEDALEVINQLDVKTYEYKTAEYAQMNLDKEKQIGMIAQELEKVLPHLVKEQLHPQKTKKDEEGKEVVISEAVEYKAVNYAGLIPVLTQGIKELSTENTKIKAENIELKEAMAELRNIVGELKQQFSNIENNMQNCCLESNTPSNKEAITTIKLNGNKEQAILEQNAPNPFNIQTQIRYYIPSFATKAQMIITDNRGAILKTVSLAETGFGTVFIKAGELAAGTYAYTLFVDGNKVATKQMVLIK